MKKGFAKEFTKGILVENPVLRLVLGTCPTLAVTTSAINGLGMGISALVVLVCSNVAISALRKVIPDRVRIPAYITIIATFVTVIQMFIKAYLPSINTALGIYLPLIVVNCIILGRAEMFASKNSVLPSMLDGLGMGVGFTAALVIMGGIREIIGTGKLFGYSFSGVPVMTFVIVGAVFLVLALGAILLITKGKASKTLILTAAIIIFAVFGLLTAYAAGYTEPMLIMIMAPGGFFVFGVLMALANKLAMAVGKKPVTSLGCQGCQNAENCAFCEIEKEPETSTDNNESEGEQ